MNASVSAFVLSFVCVVNISLMSGMQYEMMQLARQHFRYLLNNMVQEYTIEFSLKLLKKGPSLIYI